MRRIFLWCAAVTVLILGVSLTAQEIRDASSSSQNSLRGTYAFTLAETCVNQISVNTPGFDSNLHIVDPMGVETYGGASDGFMVFDGFGGVTIQNGRATNIMNAANRLLPPQITPIPLGFGLGGALPFTCTGTYSLQAAKTGTGQTMITAPLTCNAVIPLPNALGTNGFQSQFSFTGVIPANTSNLLLTDIGNTVQPVTIFFPGPPASSVSQQRICTRSANLVLVNSTPLSSSQVTQR